MAKIQILGDAVVLTSAIKTETLKQLAKYAPKALKLVDKESKAEVFAVGVGRIGSASQHGVVFAGSNEEGFANLTLQLDGGMTNNQKKEFVKDRLGFALLNLNKIEEQITLAAGELSGAFAQVEDSVEVIG